MQRVHLLTVGRFVVDHFGHVSLQARFRAVYWQDDPAAHLLVDLAQQWRAQVCLQMLRSELANDRVREEREFFLLYGVVRIVVGEHGEASLAQRRIGYRGNLLEVHRDC
jgi:hypothetical protein